MSANLALTRPDPTMSKGSLRVMMAAAQRYVASGLLPSAIKTPQQALVIMQAGREIGVPATYALRNIHVIEGKPTVSAELLMALVRRTYGQAAIRVKSSSAEACTVEYREQGWDGVSSLTFTLDDAKRAGLAGKPMWSKYPRAMLRSRAVSEAVRTAFPEAIAGLYTPDELGADVVVTSDGAVEFAEAARPDLRVVEGSVVEPTRADDVRAAAMVTGAAPFDRARAERHYARLAEIAAEREHPQAEKVRAKRADQLDDAKLIGSVRTLRTWFPDVTDDELDATGEADGGLVDAF